MVDILWLGPSATEGRQLGRNTPGQAPNVAQISFTDLDRSL
jgi:hypothetical protein